MKKCLLCSLLLMLVTLCACSGSRVVLLDSGKAQNAIVVHTEAGETVLDRVNSYADISSTRALNVKVISEEELQQEYGELIALAPKKPVEFLLYFEPGGTVLTTSSQKQLTGIAQAIVDRAPCEVNIIGHADSTGSKEYNINLSLKRARQIRRWLHTQELDILNIYVESYGEEDPLIPTADGVPEPRNRRVEILVR